ILDLDLTVVLAEQRGPRVLAARGEQKHPLAALRQPERARVDHAIRPRVAAPIELRGEPAHRLAAIELEHERDVLEQQPARLVLRAVKETKDLPDQAGSATGDSHRPPCLAQILTGNPRHYEVAFGDL